MNKKIILTDWQKRRMDESNEQIEQGKCFSNDEANRIVENWLNEK